MKGQEYYDLVKQYVDKATVETLEIKYKSFVKLQEKLEEGIADKDLISLSFVFQVLIEKLKEYESATEMFTTKIKWHTMEDLPKKDGFYLVTFTGELWGGEPDVGICDFENGKFSEETIIAWGYLPSIYKEVAE